MEKTLLVCFISFYARLVIGATDPNMCMREFEVSYTVTERTPLDSYDSSFIPILKQLNVQGEMREVVSILTNKTMKV